MGLEKLGVEMLLSDGRNSEMKQVFRENIYGAINKTEEALAKVGNALIGKANAEPVEDGYLSRNPVAREFSTQIDSESGPAKLIHDHPELEGMVKEYVDKKAEFAMDGINPMEEAILKGVIRVDINNIEQGKTSVPKSRFEEPLSANETDKKLASLILENVRNHVASNGVASLPILQTEQPTQAMSMG